MVRRQFAFTDIDKTVKRRLGENSNGVLCHVRFEILFYIMRRKWQPIPIFLPGNPRQDFRGAWRVTVHGVAKESDTTEQLNNKKTILHQRRDRIYEPGVHRRDWDWR